MHSVDFYLSNTTISTDLYKSFDVKTLFSFLSIVTIINWGWVSELFSQVSPGLADLKLINNALSSKFNSLSEMGDA